LILFGKKKGALKFQRASCNSANSNELHVLVAGLGHVAVAALVHVAAAHVAALVHVAASCAATVHVAATCAAAVHVTCRCHGRCWRAHGSAHGNCCVVVRRVRRVRIVTSTADS
jgi:hypothetical protein